MLVVSREPERAKMAAKPPIFASVIEKWKLFIIKKKAHISDVSKTRNIQSKYEFHLPKVSTFIGIYLLLFMLCNIICIAKCMSSATSIYLLYSHFLNKQITLVVALSLKTRQIMKGYEHHFFENDPNIFQK